MTLEIILTFYFFYSCLFSSAQNIEFKDRVFFREILNYEPKIDLNNDNIIQLDEADKVYELRLMKKDLTVVDDILHFKNLKKIVLTDNRISTLNISALEYLEEIYCAKNELSTLIIHDLASLRGLYCGVNDLKFVKLFNIENIESLNLMDNELKQIDLTNFKKLKYLILNTNKLKTVDISQNRNLIQVSVDGNSLKKLDITNNLNIKFLYIDNNVKLIGNENQLKPTPKPPPVKVKN